MCKYSIKFFKRAVRTLPMTIMFAAIFAIRECFLFRMNISFNFGSWDMIRQRFDYIAL